MRTTKDALKRTLNRSLLTFRELETVIYRIEGMINTRPLTPLSDDLNDVRPLSPNDFLRDGTSGTEGAIDPPTETQSAGSSLGARWRHRQKMLTHLWQRWQRELYVRELRDVHREAASNPEVGDLVLVGDNPASPPVLWKTGRIIQLYNRRDGLPRSASVQLSDGTEISRPVQRLYLLESSS